MNRIKVLYVITGLTTGGAEMMLYKNVTLIDRRKYEPIVVSLTPKGVISTWIEEEGIPVYSLHIEKGIRSIIMGVCRYYKIIKEFNPHIIHAHLFHADFLSRIVGKVARVPVMIGTIHSEDIGGRNRELLLLLTDRLTDYITVVCQTIATKLISSRVINRKKTEVIFNGINVDEFQVTNRKVINGFTDEIQILSVGRLHKEKNFSLLIEVVEDLISTYPTLKCLIAGDGEEEETLNRLVKERGLQDHVFLLGRRFDIPQLLANSDLFVLPSNCEGMSVAVLEAMASSKLVIATDVGGTAEIIREETGIIIPPYDKQQLYSAIKKVIEMREKKRKEMGKKARERVEKEFDINETVKKTERLYDRLLTEKAPLKG
ncbi:glycosyltransferase [Pseudogracilibacillus auburnensis]|uniref:Glycosyltransferase involved in cell wall biosynthesis n=1 Tax=Pseudogracilibacillus auburnensis TaxID=1494959 RepID=A0A2V3VFG9_9BACI|nr:glycosyltransferase [Pseudogracilibacillus auburnensis]PXW80497.1 glycosyltransferase involved in cell wall biosynthesis [Pseudogracilibacillus auburnensis]